MLSMPIIKLLPLTAAAAHFYKNHKVAYEDDSGLDLFIVQDQLIKAKTTAAVPLGFCCAAFNDKGRNIGFFLMPRSSISKTPLRFSNSVGLNDAGYRGEMRLTVDNVSEEDYWLKTGDRIAQAVCSSLKPFTVELVTELPASQRGERGHGSTGIANMPPASFSLFQLRKK